jgi:hypothetical protein
VWPIESVTSTEGQMSLCGIGMFTVVVSVHTVTNMYGSHSCYSHVPVLQYSYCMPLQSSLSLYQCTLLPICTVATAVTAMCQYCSTVTVCDSHITYFPILFWKLHNFQLLILNAVFCNIKVLTVFADSYKVSTSRTMEWYSFWWLYEAHIRI